MSEQDILQATDRVNYNFLVLAKYLHDATWSPLTEINHNCIRRTIERIERASRNEP